MKPDVFLQAVPDALHIKIILNSFRKRQGDIRQQPVFIVSLLPVFICGGLFLSGCAPVYYTPTTHNVPLLQEKGEGALSFSIGESIGNSLHPTQHVELQGAYAITDKYGLILNTASFGGGGGGGTLLEFGSGYYLPFWRGAVFETYGLVGGGRIEMGSSSTPSDTLFSRTPSSGTLESKLFKYGIQAALGYKTKYLDFSVSTRIAMLHYYDISGNFIFHGEDQVQFLSAKDNHLLVEPAMTLRIGYDFIKLQIQVGKSKNLSHPDFKQNDRYAAMSMGYALDK